MQQVHQIPGQSKAKRCTSENELRAELLKMKLSELQNRGLMLYQNASILPKAGSRAVCLDLQALDAADRNADRQGDDRARYQSKLLQSNQDRVAWGMISLSTVDEEEQNKEVQIGRASLLQVKANRESGRIVQVITAGFPLTYGDHQRSCVDQRNGGMLREYPIVKTQLNNPSLS